MKKTSISLKLQLLFFQLVVERSWSSLQLKNTVFSIALIHYIDILKAYNSDIVHYYNIAKNKLFSNFRLMVSSDKQ